MGVGEGNAIMYAKFCSVEERETGTQSNIRNARMREREKARGIAEREEERKERGHASREGPAGTRAQLCYYQYLYCVL